MLMNIHNKSTIYRKVADKGIQQIQSPLKIQWSSMELFFVVVCCLFVFLNCWLKLHVTIYIYIYNLLFLSEEGVSIYITSSILSWLFFEVLFRLCERMVSSGWTRINLFNKPKGIANIRIECFIYVLGFSLNYLIFLSNIIMTFLSLFFYGFRNWKKKFLQMILQGFFFKVIMYINYKKYIYILTMKEKNL